MAERVSMDIIAHIRSDFPTKFGIPRQSGLVDALRATIVFEPEYRNPDALRGLEGYSHLWLIWQFSQVQQQRWRPTVRPPRLGGNTRMGIFATRSPYRPNPIGLSSVRLEDIQLHTNQGPLLLVAGADLLDGTPIYEIKPYLPYTYAHPNATSGFALQAQEKLLQVEVPNEWLPHIPEGLRDSLLEVLAQDPRPAYQQDPQRIYGMEYAGLEVRFRVEGTRLILCEVKRM